MITESLSTTYTYLYKAMVNYRTVPRTSTAPYLGFNSLLIKFSVKTLKLKYGRIWNFFINP